MKPAARNPRLSSAVSTLSQNGTVGYAIPEGPHPTLTGNILQAQGLAIALHSRIMSLRDRIAGAGPREVKAGHAHATSIEPALIDSVELLAATLRGIDLELEGIEKLV